MVSVTPVPCEDLPEPSLASIFQTATRRYFTQVKTVTVG